MVRTETRRGVTYIKMYDLSSKFNTFYSSCVVLSQDDQDKLHRKKDLNIQRLKDGLAEYNEENNTSYSIVETCVQGSVAMSTVVQNENSNYDIDVAVVFNKSTLGEKGAQATRNIVANALKRKTKQFNAEPEVKTSCVRVQYADGYHIDFAVYRRSWNSNDGCWKYEHAGSEWKERDLHGLTDWFKQQNNNSNGKHRKVIRLSKMFCNSRASWKNMPSGLLQTVICNKTLQVSYNRTDELFYYTMQEIIKRLETDLTVEAPVDNGRGLTPRQTDLQKMMNWKNRLRSKMEDLQILFNEDCSKEDALQAWYGFFNHEYWDEQVLSENSSYSSTAAQKSVVIPFSDTEQFIEDFFPVKIQYHCRVESYVSGDGWRDQRLNSFLSRFKSYIPHHFKVRCDLVNTDCPSGYEVFWKVKNVGPEAERRNMLRGQIQKRGKTITEPTNFFGNHYIECYIVKDNVCVARTRIEVPIGRR